LSKNKVKTLEILPIRCKTKHILLTTHHLRKLFYVSSFSKEEKIFGLEHQKNTSKISDDNVLITFLLVVDFMESPLWKNCHRKEFP
jgi:hypothetical protein